VVLCEGGAYRGVRGSGVAVDHDGKTIREFRGNAGAGHMKNFFDAVRARDAKQLAASVEIGHSSAGWAHVLNAAYRTAHHPGLKPPSAATHAAGFDRLDPLIQGHLKAHGLEGSAELRTSGLFAIDADSEEFSGEGAEQANAFLGKPKYRGGFAIPG
jgi:hypothetical protein